MTAKIRRNSVISAEQTAKMERIFQGALEIIRKHRTITPTSAHANRHPTEARSIVHRSRPPTGRITAETYFRRVEGRTRIQTGSLRALVLAQAPGTLAEFSLALGQDARGVVGKLMQAGWLEIVSPK